MLLSSLGTTSDVDGDGDGGYARISIYHRSNVYHKSMYDDSVGMGLSWENGNRVEPFIISPLRITILSVIFSLLLSSSVRYPLTCRLAILLFTPLLGNSSNFDIVLRCLNFNVQNLEVKMTSSILAATNSVRSGNLGYQVETLPSDPYFHPSGVQKNKYLVITDSSPGRGSSMCSMVCVSGEFSVGGV